MNQNFGRFIFTNIIIITKDDTLPKRDLLCVNNITAVLLCLQN